MATTEHRVLAEAGLVGKLQEVLVILVQDDQDWWLQCCTTAVGRHLTGLEGAGRGGVALPHCHMRQL